MSIYLINSGPEKYDSISEPHSKEYHYISSPCNNNNWHVVPQPPANQRLQHVPLIYQDVSPFIPKVGPSWKNVKKDRLIKMTDFERKFLKKESFVVGVPRMGSWSCIYPWAVGYDGCSPQLGPLGQAYATWKSNWTYQRIIDTNSRVYYAPVFDPSTVSVDEQDVRSAVVASANSGFDVLTGLAEFPETLELVFKALQAARRPLQGMRAIWQEYLRRDKKQRGLKFHSDLLSQWMQYRYGIAPLVMQIEDAIKLLNSNVTEFSTSREGELVKDSTSTKPWLPDGFFCYQKQKIDIKIIAVGKSKYSNHDTYLIDLLTFNPLQTAWELIPLSFVVDWFVNVGDMLFNMTSSIGDLSLDRKFCSSIKYEVVTETWLYDKADYHYERVETQPTKDYRGNVLRPPFKSEYNFHRITDQLLFRETYSGYRRLVFKPDQAADLHFNPNLNWKRMIDGYALSFNHVSNLIKSLRK